MYVAYVSLPGSAVQQQSGSVFYYFSFLL